MNDDASVSVANEVLFIMKSMTFGICSVIVSIILLIISVFLLFVATINDNEHIWDVGWYMLAISAIFGIFTYIDVVSNDSGRPLRKDIKH